VDYKLCSDWRCDSVSDWGWVNANEPVQLHIFMFHFSSEVKSLPLLQQWQRSWFTTWLQTKKLKSAQRDTNLRAGTLQRDRTF